jgi:uncharacterized SAM-binding protein YcdF (DUF218 family)
MSAAFVLKKIVTPFLYPLSLGLEILIIGLLLLCLRRTVRAGRWAVALGVLFLALFSYGGPADFLAGRLESRYPALLQVDRLPPVRWIAVLGGGHEPDPARSALDQLSDATLRRLVEGVRLQQALPGSRLIFAGGRIFGSAAVAETMARAAQALGVDPGAIVLRPSALDTEHEARVIRDVTGADPFLLVTSATHMPRALALFEGQGMQPIPAPTDFLVKRCESSSPRSFFPAAEELWKTERVFHEYFGLLWGALVGKHSAREPGNVPQAGA